MDFYKENPLELNDDFIMNCQPIMTSKIQLPTEQKTNLHDTFPYEDKAHSVHQDSKPKRKVRQNPKLKKPVRQSGTACPKHKKMHSKCPDDCPDAFKIPVKKIRKSSKHKNNMKSIDI